MKYFRKVFESVSLSPGKLSRIAFAGGILVTSLFALGAFAYQSPTMLISLPACAAWLALGFASWRAAADRLALGAAAYFLAFVVLLGWWASIEPRNDRVWSAEMARNLAYTRNGDIIIVRNVRNFAWTGPATADERWETRRYDLSQLMAVDIATLHWKGPSIGHTYFSFVWRDGQALSISIEIRKEVGESYSSIGGFFKAYELAILAGDERDFYGWRVHFPDEDIQLYRTRASGEEAARLLTALLDEANALDKTPAFYNTLTDNCTTEVWLFTGLLGAGRPFDWRLVATGHLPEFLHDHGLLTSDMPFASLEAKSHILSSARTALQAGADGPAFSAAIRKGIMSEGQGST